VAEERAGAFPATGHKQISPPRDECEQIGGDSHSGNKNGNPESLVALFVLILEVRSRNFRLPVEKL